MRTSKRDYKNPIETLTFQQLNSIDRIALYIAANAFVAAVLLTALVH